jgi:hypothetical protein
VAIIAAVACTWWVQQSSIAAESAGFYLVILTAGYLVVRLFGRNAANGDI